MSDPFLAEIRMFGFYFAPKGWAPCAGQLLPISQNTALYALLGVMYGGDGMYTMGLPNLQGAAVLQQGTYPVGPINYRQGEMAGEPTVSLTQSQMPIHTHGFNATTVTGTTTVSSGNQPAAVSVGGTKDQSYSGQMYSSQSPNTPMAPAVAGPSGSGAPHENMMPYLALNFCIALQGIFPPRP